MIKLFYSFKNWLNFYFLCFEITFLCLIAEKDAFIAKLIVFNCNLVFSVVLNENFCNNYRIIA